MRINLFKLASVTALLLAVSITFSSQSAAALIISPNPNSSAATAVPKRITDQLEKCDQPPNNFGGMAAHWVSQAGQGAVEDIKLPSGTDPNKPIALDYHVISTTCYNYNDVTNAQSKITSWDTNSITGLNATDPPLVRGTWQAASAQNPNGAKVGETKWAMRTLYFLPVLADGSHQFKADGTPYKYNVEIGTRPMNQKSNDEIYCLNPPDPANTPNPGPYNDWLFDNCTQGAAGATITVTIPAGFSWVQGRKVDNTGNSNGAYGNDNINIVKVGTSGGRNDSANPFGAQWDNLAAQEMYDVTAADKIPGWQVVGAAWCDISKEMDACNAAGFSSNPKNYPGIKDANGIPHGGFQAGTTRRIGKLNAGGNYTFRWVYERTGTPRVTPFCDNNTAIVTGKATDSDWAGALSIELYVDGQGSGNLKPSIGTTNNTGDFTIDVSQYVPKGTTHTIYIKAYNVDNKNKRTPPDGWGSTVCDRGGSSASCPGQNTDPQVNLPDAPVPDKGLIETGSIDKTGSTTTPKQQYYKEVPDKFHITGAYDQYAGPTHLNDNGTTGWTGTDWQTNPFTLHYNEYVTQYPYDDHMTTVTYEQRYAETYFYTSSTADGYTCPDGSAPTGNSGENGHAKTCSAPGTADRWSCPAGYGDGSSATCQNDVPKPAKADGTCATDPASVPSTPTADNGTCMYHHLKPGTANRWSCPAGYGDGSSSTCTRNGQPYYNWHYDPTTPDASMPVQRNQSTTVNRDGTQVQVLNECYKRNFTVQQPNENPRTDVTQVSFDNNETPNNVTINTQTAAHFNLLHNGIGVRHPMGVNGLTYTGNYYIEHANGSVVSLRPTDTQGQSIPATVYSDGGSNQTSYSTGPIAVSLPPLLVGDKICAQFVITPGAGEVDENANQVPGTSSGSVNSTQIPNPPTCSAPITNQPYSRFYGNDVLAGVVFDGGGNSCNSAAAITTFNKGNGVTAGGSGAQFAAMSLGGIQQFTSAFLRSVAPTSPKGLSFANTTGGYGGDFGGACTAIPDYYGAKKPSSTTATTLGALGGFPAGSSSYTTSGGTLNGLNVPTGSSVSVFVNGNVYISNNVTLDKNNWTFDPLNRTTTVPSFYLVVKGNIYIAPGVSQLDGVYVAQPGSGGGVIRTCAQSDGSPFLASTTDQSLDFYVQCNKQLTINGAFIAQEVKFGRSFSSLRHSVAGESPLTGNPGSHACDPSGSPSLNDCSAEIFNFSPETYINMPALLPASSAKKNNYDFITTLSPVL